jgi:hypothetical protein
LIVTLDEDLLSMKHQFAALLFLIFGYAGFAQDRYLEVTSGGGVAGTVTRYQIATDGRVIKGKGLGEINYSEEAKLKKCSTKRYFKNAKVLMNSYPEFNHPGNLYFSIGMNDLGRESQITWGDADQKVPEDVQKLYQKINTALARLTFVPIVRK